MPLSRRRGSILIVEDDRATRDFLAVALKTAGFHVATASDGLEALYVLDVAMPSLIVLDLGLPRLSGRDVARELASRADTKDIPIVVVTGFAPEGLPTSPAVCVLRKPVDPDVVVATVEECLGRGRVSLRPAE